jgi:hypothetical protein
MDSLPTTCWLNFLPSRVREGWPQVGVGLQHRKTQGPPRSGKPDLPLPQAVGENILPHATGSTLATYTA